jgi:hypothetical protein
MRLVEKFGHFEISFIWAAVPFSTEASLGRKTWWKNLHIWTFIGCRTGLHIVLTRKEFMFKKSLVAQRLER